MAAGAFLATVFVLLFGFLASGMWVATASALVGLFTLWTKFGFSTMIQLVGNTVWSSASTFTLATIPLFIFMGLILLESRLSESIYGSIEPTANHFPGGLLHTNIAVGAFFAATSGSTIAAAATLGKVSLPEMEKRGYPLGISLGSVAAGSFLAPVIPPSNMMIFYCMLVEASIGRQFIAGVFPGLILAVLFSLFIALRISTLRQKNEMQSEVLPWRQSLAKLKGIWVIALLILIVLGSIYGGLATATEAAALGASGAVILAAAHGRLNWQIIKKSTMGTLRVTGQLMFIFVGVKVMSGALALAGVVDFVTKWLIALPVPTAVVLMMIFALFLVMGCFIESIPMMLMIVPLVYPAIISFGYDQYWFGILVTLISTAGNITPPVGVTLFTLQAVRPDIKITRIYSGVMPFLIVILIGLALVTAFPEIALWLPSTMLGE
jgi:tripartite ATP-independent transporter DctM subunit